MPVCTQECPAVAQARSVRFILVTGPENQVWMEATEHSSLQGSPCGEHWTNNMELGEDLSPSILPPHTLFTMVFLEKRGERAKGKQLALVPAT